MAVLPIGVNGISSFNRMMVASMNTADAFTQAVLDADDVVTNVKKQAKMERCLTERNTTLRIVRNTRKLTKEESVVLRV